MESTKYYQYGNPFKVWFRKHYCLYCGNRLEIKKHSKLVNSKSPEAEYYDFTYGDSNMIIGDCIFIHNIFFCPKCGKEIEYVTQLSFENNEKWMEKAYVMLLHFYLPKQIKMVWVDKFNNVLEIKPSIENLNSISFQITTEEKAFYIPCSIVYRKKYWERPIKIIKDKSFNKVVDCLKKMKPAAFEPK